MTDFTAQKLLDRLQGVVETGPGRWIALCPAHADRRPSLSVRQLDDGRTLVNCFAQCETQHVLAAVDLTFADLYPADKLSGHRYAPVRRRLTQREFFQMLRAELMVVCLAAEHLADGIKLTELDRERLHQAADRVRGALNAAA